MMHTKAPTDADLWPGGGVVGGGDVGGWGGGREGILSKEALHWKAGDRWFKSASALFSFLFFFRAKGCGFWTLPCDFALHS